MFFEDARDLIIPAIKLLETQKNDLGCADLKIWSLADFNEHARAHHLRRSHKETIVDQAILLIDQFYAHLPFKRARYATDPVQSLRLVRAQLDQLSDMAFHARMIQALVSLHDAHTFYSLPAPYRGAFAFLPFRMQSFHAKDGKRKYLVTQVLEGFDHGLFQLEAEITSWNGVPVDQFIERQGQEDPGANPSSRLARSINRSCTRSLSLNLSPQENFVVLGYIPSDGRDDEFGIVLPWYVGTTEEMGVCKRIHSASSVNESAAQNALARQMLFHRHEMMAGPPQPAADLAYQSKYPHVFSFQYSGGISQSGGVDPAALIDPVHPDRKFGYILIKTFDLDPSDAKASDNFVREFRRIAGLMRDVAPDGLILDVRSNPGGSIDAAERILQFLTPFEITPATFHFLSSRLTQLIASVLQSNQSRVSVQPGAREWAPWMPDLCNSVVSGDHLTSGKPLTAPEEANDTGQLYQGPVTLIIDAMAYSATDIFSAGFQDHAIGTIIGVDENTGGGGANRWMHDELLRNLDLYGLHDLPLEELPAGARLGVAIRRSSRVGKNAGAVLEDEGVKADKRYRLTRTDILDQDRDLLAFACAHLASIPSYALNIASARVAGEAVEVTVNTKNLFRLECMVNNTQQLSIAASGGLQSFSVPTVALLRPPLRLQINGFATLKNPISKVRHLQLVATSISFFETATPTPATAEAAAG